MLYLEIGFRKIKTVFERGIIPINVITIYKVLNILESKENS